MQARNDNNVICMIPENILKITAVSMQMDYLFLPSDKILSGSSYGGCLGCSRCSQNLESPSPGVHNDVIKSNRREKEHATTTQKFEGKFESVPTLGFPPGNSTKVEIQ